MPDKLYQDCRTVISGCRAIFEDLLESGMDILPIPLEKISQGNSHPQEQHPAPAQKKPVAPPDSLEKIDQELVACQCCPLSGERKKVVLGTGNPNARLVLIGTFPDAEEEEGIPFVGEAGQLLERILFAMKLRREDVYICHLVKCRPLQDREPETSEVTTCEAFLKRQLAVIAPEIILSLGEFTTQSLLQTDELLSQLRGRWHSYAGIPLMPTFHPLDLLQKPAGKHQVWEDVKQVIHRLQDVEG